MPTTVAEAALRKPPSSRVGRLASSDTIHAGGFTPGVILAERYRIIGLLGRGGMGEVYRADDLKLGQPVALKFLPQRFAADQEHIDRFYSEVRIARQVSHPNVCRVYDVGEIDGQQYLSMEYVDGEDLASLLKRIGRLPTDKALDISRELCAGLAAAHDLGVLHRDIKPSNVMIDGRGRARITDFGLAVAAEDGFDGEISGTPTYMAPEQFAGKGASVRSDVYALGLVLYELYTGRKAFDGATVREVRRKHEDDTPTAPSVLTPGLDPVVERVILRCLEKDPSARPVSAAQVAKALPGGDPLAAALAAGETPSPEMVAAAGEEGALSPVKAGVLFAATVVLVGAVLGLGRRATDQGLAPFPKSPEVLADRARELAKNLGYTAEPADSAWWWERQSDYLSYRAARERSPSWWRSLATTEPHPWLFWYRESPGFLVPVATMGGTAVGPNDPPMETPGMLRLAMDARGNLARLLAVPSRDEPSGEAASTPDWRPLLAAAGLDPARLAPAAPSQFPPEPFDARADWEGTYASNPDARLHVAAAALRGKPVWFEVRGPWTRPETPVSGGFAFLIFIIATWVGGIFLARRNLRLGSGDRRGAFRVAAFTFGTAVLYFLFWTHYVPSSDLAWKFLDVMALCVFFGVFSWLAYIAIEPILRRRWPELLFSWSRILTGRFRDPLVGRDVLAGLAIGAAMAVTLETAETLPYWIDIPGMTPTPPSRQMLLSPRESLADVLGNAYIVVLNGLGFVTLFALGQALFRRKALAVGVAALAAVMLTLSFTGENYAVDVPCAIVLAALFVLVTVRFGVLALMISYLVFPLLTRSPITLELSRWYAGRGLVVVGVILALAVWAFRVALGGRKAFGGAGLGEA